MKILLIIFLGTLSIVLAHVSLTFPPARTYDLDFLDTFRTIKPCGMNRGTVLTTISNGKEFTISWHLGYPHKGSFLIELLDKSGNKVKDLTPNGDFVPVDETVQNYTVNIDSKLECVQCTIRLVRQALEWGPTYRFQSCADVDIVSISNFKEDCLGHGVPSSSGTCTCHKLYFGARCQFKNDCDIDDDCNNGKCIDIGGTALPLKQCYCKPGWFGSTCNYESNLKERKAFNVSDYHYENIGEDQNVKFYWRVIQKEFEGMISGPTSSYLAIGWRPINADKSCQGAFPSDAPAPIGKDFHAMDCTDMIIGSVRNDYSRIGDYYTRDRSTPRLDESFWGQKSDLTAALAWEEDGRTFVWFRRFIKGSGLSDHSFSGKLHLIWAHGRSDIPFYTNDELKYHGPYRGISLMTINGGSPSNNMISELYCFLMIGAAIYLF